MTAVGSASVAGSGSVAGLLADVALPVPGLYRRHPTRNLGTVAAAIRGAFQGTGPVRLGSARSLVVIAVDGLGYGPAASALEPDSIQPLTSEFPTTTVACLLTSVTGQPADRHGFIGVQYLHPDGLRTVNCHDGTVTAPYETVPDEAVADRTVPHKTVADQTVADKTMADQTMADQTMADQTMADQTGADQTAPARPTRTPRLPTVFDELAVHGVTSRLLPNELADLHEDALSRLAHGARTGGSRLPPGASPQELVGALGGQVEACVEPESVTWAYLDLDSHVHRHGYDGQTRAALADLDSLAGRLREAGTAVLVFSDHGLAASRPAPETLDAWHEAESRRWCRLPGGGAGRTRWLYPHPQHEDRLAGLLAAWFPHAVVTSPGQLADWDLITAPSIGQRRLGEIVLLALGQDFPVPDAAASFEHGSMTADEVVVPLAAWSP
jgi:hypothetical protein